MYVSTLWLNSQNLHLKKVEVKDLSGIIIVAKR